LALTVVLWQAYLVHGAFAFILYTYGALTGALGYYGVCSLLVPGQVSAVMRKAIQSMCVLP